MKRFFHLLLWGAIGFGSAHAHETWLAARQQTVAPGQALAFDMSSGETFPQLGTAIAPERVALAGCRQGSVTLELKAGQKTAQALRLEVRPPGAGGVDCWVRLSPRKLGLAPSKVQEYLDDIDAPASVRGAWAAAPEPRQWIEVYTKNAQAVVPASARAPRSDATGKPQPVGLNLEFLPDAGLTRGRLDSDLTLTLLRDGQPLPGVSVALSGKGRKEPLRRRSDAQGRVAFPRPANGRWMLSATDLRSVDAAQGTWESQFATLVFDLLPGR